MSQPCEPLPPIWRKILDEVSHEAAKASVAARERGDHGMETMHAVTALLAHKALQQDRALRAGDN